MEQSFEGIDFYELKKSHIKSVFIFANRLIYRLSQVLISAYISKMSNIFSKFYMVWDKKNNKVNYFFIIVNTEGSKYLKCSYKSQQKNAGHLKDIIKMVLFQFHHYLVSKHPCQLIRLYRYLQHLFSKDNLHCRALVALAVLQTV